MSDDAKKKLSYAEIAFSVVGSLPVLAWFGFVVIGIVFTLILFAIGGGGFLSGGNNKPSNFYKDIPILLLYFITFIILNPVSLTALRIHLHDTLTEQQQNIIAGITIPVAVYMMYLTVLLNGGFFFN